MSYKHLSISERSAIAYYLSEAISVTKIAKLLNRHSSTIYREITRNTVNNEYVPDVAQETYQERFTSMKNHLKRDTDLLKQIKNKLEKYWSPEQICGHFKIIKKESFVAFSTVYNWIRQGFFGNIKSVLRRSGKPYKRYTSANIMKGGKHISERSSKANARIEIGHYELDTVVGPLGTKGAIVTAVDRCSRLLLAKKVENRKAVTVTKAIEEMFLDIPVHSMTFDNGKEFTNFKDLENKLHVMTYFANPRSPWQRGSNENTNGLLRQFFPKGKLLDKVTDNQVQEAVNLINSRPRKVLNYKTAYELNN